MKGDSADAQMLHPYYYMGHEIFKYDTFVFPVDGIDDLYPVLKNSSNTVNFKKKNLQMFHQFQVLPNNL